MEDSECVCLDVFVLESKAMALNFSSPSVLKDNSWGGSVCGGDSDSVGGCW